MNTKEKATLSRISIICSPSFMCVFLSLSRAALEEQYAKGLLKLSKSSFGDVEEGYVYHKLKIRESIHFSS